MANFRYQTPFFSILLDAYRKQKSGWNWYEQQFMDLMAKRQVETTLSRGVIDGGCLLCSEDLPEHCHRRLIAEYLKQK
jgi:uncharacterized protein (DUF488 family)